MKFLTSSAMEDLNIHCITWNVETTWPEQDLHCLLGLDPKKDSLVTSYAPSSLPDVFIISLQEVKSQPQNVLLDTMFEEPWTNALRLLLGRHGFVRVCGERLQGIVTAVFAKRQHVPHVRDIHTTVVRTGMAGFWGNKGGVSIRFSIYGCSICIVNCHLAAHDSGYEERVANFNAILNNTLFSIGETSNILYHDYVFWMGDMNFRFDLKLSGDEIANYISSGQLDDLSQFDQLREAQKAGDAFDQLVEGSLHFPPTYKYLEGTCTYDLIRRPAWTDRILHQVHRNAYDNVTLGLEQKVYNHIEQYTQSDHKPVIANYRIKVFANHIDRQVSMVISTGWTVGEGGCVDVCLDSDVSLSPWDYVALFKADFTSVSQYVTYMYIPNPTVPQRTFQLVFNDELIQGPGLYRLLYYSDRYSSYLGMSEPFLISQRQD